MEGDKYDVSDDIDDDVAVRRDQSRYSTGLGNDKIPFWPGAVLALPVVICAGGAAWSLQSSVAADCDCRIAARQRVSKIILTRRIPGGGT